jgi:selenocysteine lyase/cysteine desulfurase
MLIAHTGTYPKAVQTALHSYQALAESNPDLWMRIDVHEELLKVRKLLAKLLITSEKDIVMIPNATSGMNAIFRSMVFRHGERILHFSTIYGLGITGTDQLVLDLLVLIFWY